MLKLNQLEENVFLELWASINMEMRKSVGKKKNKQKNRIKNNLTYKDLKTKKGNPCRALQSLIKCLLRWLYRDTEGQGI